MAMSRRRLSDADRAERRRKDREQLQRAAEQLLSSEGWQRWLRVRSQAGLARLSLSNQLLVAMARPDATFVAGFKSWLRLGYAVKNGEKAMRIIAPLRVKERDRASGEETDETRVLFKTVFVFDTLSRACREHAERQGWWFGGRSARRAFRPGIDGRRAAGSSVGPLPRGRLLRWLHARGVRRRSPVARARRAGTEEVNMRNRRRLTDEERDRRRAQDRERLREAAEQLLSSEGWRRWVRARASHGLGRYSLTNQLLVAIQSDGRATFVAGFKQWLALGYCVRKSERALRVMAPMTVKERDRETGEETGETITLFKSVPVFFQEQVEPLPSGEPAPLEPPREPLTGDSHAHLLPRLRAFCESLGYLVSFEPIEGSAGGWCDPMEKRIVVDAQAPPTAQLRTLVHETAHALGVDYERYSREQSEVLADTITFVTCSSVGLAVDGESIAYVAGWGEDGGALEAVTEFASTIDALARRIEDALGAADGAGNQAQVAVA